MASNVFSSLPTDGCRFNTPPPANIPVLIVGSGPSGLFTSYLLSKFGIRSAIIEKHATRLGQPKAHALNPRSIEILRQVGLDVSWLRSQGVPTEKAFWVRWISGFGDVELGKMPYERQDEAVKDVTPEPLFNIAQPILEQFLENAALGSGLVSIHRRWLWEEVSFNSSGQVMSLVRSHKGTSGESLIICSEYLIGADGPDSTVRGKMDGVEFCQPTGLHTSKNFYRSIHCKADLLSHGRDTDLESVLYFCSNPDHPAGIISYGLNTSFVHVTIVPEAVDYTAEPMTEAQCLDIIRPCMPAVTVEPQSVTVWYTWPRIASSYTSNTEKITLVGDAAHSFPPQGGLGVNTGIADSHNLIWKLAVSMKAGMLSDGLLGTYTLERRPVAMANALQSAKNERIGRDVNDEIYKIYHRAAKDGVTLAEFMSYDKVKEETCQLLNRNKPHFDSLCLQLGYIYGQGDGTPPDDVSTYQPSSVPGARMPHAWLDNGKSTLDYVPYDSFALFHRGLDLESPPPPTEYEILGITTVDVEAMAFSQHWCDLVGIGIGKDALLVRPDQHILSHVSSMTEALEVIQRFYNYR